MGGIVMGIQVFMICYVIFFIHCMLLRSYVNIYMCVWSGSNGHRKKYSEVSE